MALVYDPNVLQQLAERLESQARSVIALNVLGGFVVGLGLAGTLMYAKPDFQIPAALLVVLCLIVGLSRGRAKAFMFRVEAQKTLCQMKIEENTRK